MIRRQWAKEAFHKTVDRFLPPGYTIEHAQSLGRARILVALLLYHVVLSGAIIALAMFAHSEYVGFNTAIAAGFSLAMLATYTGCLYLFRLSGSIFWTGHLFALTIYLVVAGAAYITGGFISPSLQIIVAIPVLVFLISGRKAGGVWLIVVLLTEVVLYQAHLKGMQFPQILQEDSLAAVEIGVWSLMCITVVACFAIYDVVNESLQRQLARERGRFAHQAAHDVLTELPNRNEFYRRLQDALAGLKREQRLAIAYLDLDGFKPVNDQYGHHTGDEVLKIISQRLIHSVRRQDTVARLGGDEFAILFLLDTPEQDITPVLEKLLKRIAEPVRAGEHLVQVSGSVGVAFAPDHGKDMDSLLKLADRSMYEAKLEKNRFCIFNPAS